MSAQPRQIGPVSLVLCTCNGAAFLGAQLASLECQEGVQEIVAVDDESTDGTADLLRDRARRDRRYRVFRNERRLGIVRNFERAIGLAQCPWIALSDQDDLWLSDKLARLRAAWDGRADLIHHASCQFRGRPPRTLSPAAGGHRKFAGSDVRRLLFRNTVIGHTTLIRADLVRSLRPFPGGVLHDWWIGAGAAVLGSVQYLDEYLVLYRIHETNAYHPIGSRGCRLRAEHAMRLRLLQRLLGLPGLAPAARSFAEDYRRRLLAAPAGFPYGLWRFYRRHAGLLFGSEAHPPSPFTAWRKSLTATLGRIRAPDAAPSVVARDPLPAR